MMKVLNTVKNNKLISFVALTYLTLGIVLPDKGAQSFFNSLYYIKEMLIIMPVILLLTSLIEAWVPTKTIQNMLGEDAGLKGYIFSFLLGSFSAGPIYAAFPVCKTLLNKGARISNIVIILSSWAVVKVPMLANEAKFLGPKFTFIRWILTSISIFLMAYLVAKIVKKEDVLKKSVEFIGENTDEGILNIESSYCIGCGICTKLAPVTFAMENKKAVVINQDIKEEHYESIQTAVDKCPAKAIKLRVENIE
ncbi:permease [Romboutsia sp.]|uniref:permease n=1 Tax=Romboutsia sp. TaxID=1965302 RepID=UPI003F355CA2